MESERIGRHEEHTLNGVGSQLNGSKAREGAVVVVSICILAIFFVVRGIPLEHAHRCSDGRDDVDWRRSHFGGSLSLGIER